MSYNEKSAFRPSGHLFPTLRFADRSTRSHVLMAVSRIHTLLLATVVVGLVSLVAVCVSVAAELDAKRQPPLSRKEVIRHCGPRTVDIEILGHDTEGKWISHAAGTILHEDGYILTCEHVTHPGDSQKVILADGTSYPYKVLARAGGSYDTAILKVDPKEKLPAVQLGHSDSVKLGEQATVIGNPSGRRHSVKHGVIDRVACGGGTQIQISQADIGPGNSGGPVFNSRGEQIAHVHVKIWTQKNISRHIRVDHVRDAFAKVFSNEDRYKQRLGIVVNCQGDAATVLAVEPDSAAAEADIRKGDVIVELDSMRIGEGYHFGLALMDHVGSAPLSVRIRRGDQLIAKKLQPKPQ